MRRLVHVVDAYKAGHGTSVASVLAGRNVGVAPGVTLIPVKVAVCDEFRISKLATIRGFAEIVKDRQNRPRQPNGALAPAVVSSSLRFSADGYLDVYDWAAWCGGAKSGPDGEPYYVACNSALDSAVYDTVAAGITVVQAAGNQYRDANNDLIARLGYGSGVYPGAVHRVITVGGTMYDAGDQNRDKTWYCGAIGPDCWDRNPGSNFGPGVNIWAPAWHVRVALAGVGYRPNDPSSTGTSFAAPLVAGAVARILQNHPSWTPAQVWAELSRKADLYPTSNDLDPSSTTNKRLLYIEPTE
jgi:subtilisin family serine protease